MAELDALTEVVARARIQEVVASYTHLGDRARYSEMQLLFDEDAELDAFGTPYVGRPAIAGFFQSVEDGSTGGPERTFIRHHVSNVSIDVHSPDEASGVSYWLVISDDGLEQSGRYRDTYRRGADGVWRFRTRTIRRDESKRPPA